MFLHINKLWMGIWHHPQLDNCLSLGSIFRNLGGRDRPIWYGCIVVEPQTPLEVLHKSILYIYKLFLHIGCGARQCGTLSNTAPAPPLVFSVPFFYIRRARRDATTSHNTKKPAKHRDHGGRAALLSSDVELMVRHNRTCGRPVHGVGRGRG